MSTMSENRVGVRYARWRHRDAAAHAFLGDGAFVDDAAGEASRAYRLGARFVSIAEPIALGPGPSAGHTLAALSFVRELTSHGMDVDWHARLTADSSPWWVFSHLFPPATLDGPYAAEALAAWRAKYHLGRCFLRRGPGFVQIRDRRHQGFRRLTVSDPDHLAAIDALLAGRGRAAVPERIVAVFERQHLVVPVGGDVWWAPYRLQRWPLPSWEV